jgi:hypothetical protein
LTSKLTKNKPDTKQENNITGKAENIEPKKNPLSLNVKGFSLCGVARTVPIAIGRTYDPDMRRE